MPIKKVKMTIWTDRMKSELTGGGTDNGQDALDQLLIATGSRQARVQALAALAECHERVCKWEDERAQEAAGNG